MFGKAPKAEEYMAPEVISILNQEVANPSRVDVNCFPDFYDLRCDIWSLGVCIHTLLEGELPYDMEDMSKFIAEGTLLPKLKSSTSSFWAAEAVKVLDAQCKGAGVESLDHDVKVCTCLYCIIRALDTSNQRARRQGQVPVFFSFRCILAAPEVSGFQLPFPGTIAYTEFLAAIMDHNIEERKDLALAAFRGFDLDGNGTITSMEMGRVIWRSVLPAIKRWLPKSYGGFI